jgi:serine/threonine protein kinase/tetratricopeptide (TPR) repeat protein
MPLHPGTRLGPYEIISLQGKGGMGEVYRAKDPRLDRDVAIKVLPEVFTNDSEALRRFEREAKSLATISHPHIVVIHDVGTDQGIFYVVMELLRGETLREHLREGRFSTEKATKIAGDIAEALAAAHSKGVIHRDLKPENIYLTEDGIVKLLDFGLARFRATVPLDQLTMAPTIATAETETGGIVGTAPYMSPEQLRGASLDARSDLFAFGSVFYEMLAGKHPFQHGGQAETLAAILKDDPPPLPHLSQPLQRVLTHCLEKAPEKRFQSARDLLFALQSADQDSAALKTSPPIALPERRRIPVFAYITILAALIAGIGILWYQKPWIRHGPLEKSIAVLPFTNLSPSREYEYFSDGITEDVVAHLSKIHDLQVISRTSTMQYKNSKKPLRQIAKELGVTTILEGSVRREGDRVRIVGQLIDAQTDHHLWAETYDRELKDIFEIQTDVARKIAEALQAQLTPAETEHIRKKPTENLLAYDYYLRGRESYLGDTKETVHESIGLFQKAIATDQNFVVAQAWLSAAYKSYYDFTEDERWRNLADATAHKALALDPTATEAFITLGRIYEDTGRCTLALEQYLKAQDIDPNYARSARRIGYAYIVLGKHDEAIRWLKRSISLDPKEIGAYMGLGEVYSALYDFDQAEIYWLKTIELSPKVRRAGLFNLYLAKGDKAKALEQLQIMEARTVDPALFPYIGWFELCLGNVDRAREYYRKSEMKWLTNPDVGYMLILLKEGRKEEAYKMIDDALKRGINELAIRDKTCLDTGGIAELYAVRGNREEAYRWLTDFVNQANSAAGIEYDPAFETLRSEKRFQDLLSLGKAKAAEMRRRAERYESNDH